MRRLPDALWQRWLAVEGFASRHYFRLLVVLAIAVVVGVFWYGLPDLLFSGLVRTLEDINTTSDAADRRSLTYSMGVMVTALAALVAAPLVVIRTYVAERQAQTAEQGHITDRFTKAVEQLGAEKTIKRTETVTDEKTGESRERVIEETVPNLEVRLGAIYALERIAEDSERDHIPIMETLCAYIRENAVPPVDAEATARAQERKPEAPEVFYPPRADIQTALTVLGRRSEARLTYEEGKKYRLDLRNTAMPRADLTSARLGPAQLNNANLQEALLGEANLQGAGLREANLQGAGLDYANLQGAGLDYANLQGAWLTCANLQGAELGGANLQGAGLRKANLQGAGLTCANLQGAGLRKANLQGAWLGGANLQGAVLGGANFNTADLRDCSVARTSLRSAVLKEAKNLSAESVKSAFGVKAGFGLTVLPDGMTPPGHWHEAEEGTEDTFEAHEAYQRAFQAWLETQGGGSKEGDDPA
ncbi:MAG: pentapeptide repeat-containing protein [Pseudomonadota bacterium]